MIGALVDRCSKNAAGRHVLCIQDTSELNYQSHKGRLKPDSGIGLVGNNNDLGFFIHPTIVIDADKGHVLGISHLMTWHRPVDKLDKHQRDYKNLPIEEKESYKWIESSLASKKALHEASQITIIEDREGDIYEQFATIPDERVNLLVRSCRDRTINSDESLYEYLHSQVPQGSYKLRVEGDIRNNRKGRIAEIEIRYAKATINRPKKCKNKSLAATTEVWVVEACEKDPPKGQSPIIWRLITSHKVENYHQACQIVEWYKQRWHIEQTFRLLKQKGVRIEDSELEQGWAIRKLTIMLFSVVLTILQMHLTLKESENNSQAITTVFNDDEINCLKILNKEYEGNTDKQKNKNKPSSLRWAAWVIARMGGWKGLASERPPGVLTLKWGLDRFYEIYFGWQLATKRRPRDVCTQ